MAPASFLLLLWMLLVASDATTTETPSTPPNTTATATTTTTTAASTTTATTGVPTTTSNYRNICYEVVGCFNNSAPFVNDGTVLPMSPDKVGTEFRLFVRGVDSYHALTYNDSDDSVRTSSFSGLRRTRVITHGWNNNITQPWALKIKDAFLKIEDSNVIMVGWGPGANQAYPDSVANTRLVAAQLRLVLQRLQREGGLDLGDVHLIGHSLGAHISGNTGRQLGGKVGRITGMDPAGPDFQNFDNAVILDKTDAVFVDSIHSSGTNILTGGAGTTTPTADIDFFVNGGDSQPGCKDGIAGFFGGTDVACSHGRSHDLFLESITSECPFTAYPCANQSEFELGRCLDCQPGGCSEMGLYADQHSARGSYFLNTRAASPYCGFHYAVTVHAGRGRGTKGTIYVTLHGSWGQSLVLRVTEEKEQLNAGVDYVGVVVSSVEVGYVETLTVHYEKSPGTFFGLFGGGSDTFKVDTVDVLSGEIGKVAVFCLPNRRLEHGKDLELVASSNGTCPVTAQGG